MPVKVEAVEGVQVNGSKPYERILDKYNVGKNGVLFIDTPRGRFSPIDIEDGRIVKMTRVLIGRREGVRNEVLKQREIEVVREGRPPF